MIDLVFLLLQKKIDSLPLAVLAGVVSNLTGTFCVNLIFFSLPLIPLLLSLTVAAFSGGIGGVISWMLLQLLEKYGISRRTA